MVSTKVSPHWGPTRFAASISHDVRGRHNGYFPVWPTAKPGEQLPNWLAGIGYAVSPERYLEGGLRHSVAGQAANCWNLANT